MANRPVVVKDTVQEILAETGGTTYDPNDNPILRARGGTQAGDGGGGLFRVTSSGATTDGGTKHVFDADASAEQSESLTNYPTWDLASSDVVWGTLSVRYGPDSNDVVSDLHLHGHRNKGSTLYDGQRGWIDYSGGRILAGKYDKWRQNMGYDTQKFEATYKYATSTRRLERVHPPGQFNLAWWGAPPADPNNPKSVTPYLNHAINTAKERYEQGGLQWAYVDIDREYYYKHFTKILDGVMLRGVGGDRPVPHRSFTTNGKLTLLPGEAVYTQKNGYDAIAEHDIYPQMQAARSTFGHEKGASEKLGVRHLEVDGTWGQNEEPFTTSNYDNIESYLQNSGDWAFWYTTGAGGQSYQKGLQFHLNNVYAHGFGGNVIAGAGADFNPSGSEFDVTGPNGVSKNVHIGDAARNHQIYGVPGTQEDWSIEGISWGTKLKIGSKSDRPTTYRNLQVIDAPSNPYGYNTSNLLNPLGVNITIDGFTFDLRGSSFKTLWNEQAGSYYPSNNGNSANVYKGGTIKLGSSGTTNLINPGRVSAPTTFKNITVEDNGGGLQIGGAFSSKSFNLFLENFDVVPQGSLSPIGGNPPYYVLGFSPNQPFSNAVPVATRNAYRNFSYQREIATKDFWGMNYGSQTAPFHPHDQFFIDSDINNGDTGLFNATSKTAGWLRMYFDNMTINMPPVGSSREQLHKGTRLGILRMRNSQDRSGRSSDLVSQSYSATSSDESNGYALIPTSLISRPRETSVTASASYNVTGVEIANSNGTLRADDDTGQEDPYLKVSVDGTITQGDSFTWTARVTPLADYQTTGVFVAREESNKSYTSGNGPFTVDLRGVAASQESRDKIIYTASSGDTSVVTANVQSDGYTLDLTEQSTGTSTITVTGEISAISASTSTTFDVTIQ